MSTTQNKIITHKVSLAISLSLLVLVILFSSCKSLKLAVAEKEEKLNVRAQTKVFDDILERQYDYHTIMAKGKVVAMGKEFTTIFKIKKDSILQASVRPFLGIEVLRLDIMPTSIVVIDRLKKEYAKVSIDQETVATMGFNFYNLQALLTNKLFLPGKEELTNKDYDKFTYTIQNNEYILECGGKNSINFLFTIDNLNLINEIDVSLLNKDTSMNWQYEKFVQDNEYTYPTQIDAKLKVGMKDVKFGITYPKLDIDTDMSIDTSIPKNYTERNIKELVRDYIK